MSNIKKYDWLDILRIVSCIAVILIHCCCTGWGVSTNIKDYTISNFYHSISRFCVPMFFMISGALFLNPNKKIEVNKFFKSKTIKITFDFIIWCLIYTIFDALIFNPSNITIGSLINGIINSKVHLWYMKVLIFVYLFLPIIKLITEQKDNKLIKYSIFIFLIFGILLYNISYLPLPKGIIDLCNFFREYGTLWYIGYFILGYYLFSTDISKKYRIIIYILGVLSVITCFGVTELVYVLKSTKIEYLYNYFSITTFFASIAIFVFVKYKFKDINYTEINLRSIGNKTYGVYLIHILVMQFLEKLGFSIFSFNFLISMPILCGSIFVISYIIISIMKKIPLLRKII